MQKITLALLLTLSAVFKLTAQEEHLQCKHEGRGFKLAGIIGHTLVNSKGLDHVFVPSWGLDIEYWRNHKVGTWAA